MYTIRGTIEVVAPILFSKWTEQASENIKTGATGGKFTDDQRMAEAMEKVYRNDSGLFLPPWNFKKCLLEGTMKAGLKEGRASAAKFFEATIFVQGDLLFGVEEPDFIHETPGRRPPKTGGACLIKRPALNAGWRLPFQLMIVDDRRSPEHIKRAVEEAGLLVGLGSWRPEYGRFVLTEWAVTKN
jgi:hypothetical protein